MTDKDIINREVERIASEIKAILQKYVDAFDCSRYATGNDPKWIYVNINGEVGVSDAEIEDSLERLCRHYNDFFAYDYDDGEEETDDNYYLQPQIYEPDVLEMAKSAVEDMIPCSPKWRRYIEMREMIDREYDNNANDFPCGDLWF